MSEPEYVPDLDDPAVYEEEILKAIDITFHKILQARSDAYFHEWELQQLRDLAHSRGIALPPSLEETDTRLERGHELYRALKDSGLTKEEVDAALIRDEFIEWDGKTFPSDLKELMAKRRRRASDAEVKDRRDLLDAFNARARAAGIRVTEDEMAPAIKPTWNQRTPIRKWVCGDNASTPSDNRLIRKFLAREPAEIWPERVKRS